MVFLALLVAVALVVGLVAGRFNGHDDERAEPEWLDFLRWDLDRR